MKKQKILEIIKKQRKNKKITQEEMANYLKIAYKTYNRKENWITEFTFLEFLMICEKLNINMSNLG